MPEALPDTFPFREFFRFDEGARPREQVRQGLGSGFIVSSEGHIVTNNHVVGDADSIRVIFSDGTTADARLVGQDPATDLAVLKIEPRPNMTVASWGDSDKIEPGAWTIAIGSPFGLGGTVTVGVLSAQSRDITSGRSSEFLQTDASINRGNSGGPLFNAAGEVIGVNTAILSPVGANVGIGFAVPSRIAKNVTDQIIRTGRVERGFLGISMQRITPELARALGLPEDHSGVLVASVEPRGPAEEAGVTPGDVVTQFDDRQIREMRDLSRAVADAKPGSEHRLTVVRDGQTRELTVKLGQRRDEQAGRSDPITGATGPEGPRLGLSLSPIPDQARRRFGVERGGVLVQRVQPDSPAAATGIRPGDVIVEAGNAPVDEVADVSEAWRKAREENKSLLLRLKREDQYLFVAVAPS